VTDIGYDFAITKNLHLGLQMTLLAGTLFEFYLTDGNTVERIDLEQGEYESLNRLDFSVGLRLNIL
jgi:hypothetical protein